MRILTGKYRGRMIKMPPGIRPTQDKTRKALFDILADVSGESFLELFAGSGAVGIEALSRGANPVVFIERDKKCAQAIAKNLGSLNSVNYRVIESDALKAVEILHKLGEKFDIIFLDPPYYRDTAKKTLQTLSVYDILAANGFIIVQHFKKDNLPEALGVLALFRQSKYGDTLLSFYRKSI